MLRVLYTLARMSLLLHSLNANAIEALGGAWIKSGSDYVGIIEESDVVRNETVLAVKRNI